MSLSVETIAQTAKAAFGASQLISTTERTRVPLHGNPKRTVEANKDSILRANGEDIARALHFSHTYSETRRLTAGVVVQRAEAEVAAGRLRSPLVKHLDLRTG